MTGGVQLEKEGWEVLAKGLLLMYRYIILCIQLYSFNVYHLINNINLYVYIIFNVNIYPYWFFYKQIIVKQKEYLSKSD